MSDLTLLDCPLSDLGLKQCEEARALAASRLSNVKTVFVSPLRRALQTAYLLFKDHAQQVKVIVHPLLRENLHTVCDVPDHFDSVARDFPWTLDLTHMATRDPSLGTFKISKSRSAQS